MPSVGRIKQLAVLGGVAAGLLAVGTSSASAANDVWLWACQGPSGEALNTAFQGGSGNCAQGITLKQNETTNADAVLAFPSVPSSTLISQVKLTRSFSGFGQAGSTSRYSAFTGGSNPIELESASVSATPADGSIDKAVSGGPAHGDDLRLKLTCAAGPCTTPASVKVTGAAIKVVEANGDTAASDTETAPQIAVGGKNSPTSETMHLDIQATDTGLGLSYAEAYFANAANTAVVGPRITQSFITSDYASCKDLTPGTPTVDLALGAICPTVGNAKIDYPTRSVPNGLYTLIVRVVDVTGRETIFKDGGSYPIVEVANDPDLGQRTQQLSIGTSGIATPVGGTNNTSNSGGVAGATATQCSSPRLSVELAQKPMRVSKRTLVLQKSKRYLFRGRLTCVVRGKRQSAPKRARIDLQSKIGKRTTDESGTTVASKGAFKIILAYTKSRSLIFRFTNSEGKVAKVTIKIKVEKKKKKSKR
jgi:hypothetical protein